MTKGTIKSFLAEKRYGFIHGDDGRDYYFSSTAVVESHRDNIVEGAQVEFDPKATPKGYRAETIVFADNSLTLYSLPSEILISKQKNIRGWEMIEQAKWVISVSSGVSLDEAKNDLIDKAKQIGANALTELEYEKTTGSEPGRGGGTHYYTVHNFRARLATVAKRNSNGSFSFEELLGINQKAKDYKQHCIDLNLRNAESNREKRNKWIWGAAIAGMPLVISGYYWVALGMCILVLSLILLNREATNYGVWLLQVE